MWINKNLENLMTKINKFLSKNFCFIILLFNLKLRFKKIYELIKNIHGKE
jgi:hypothetical protein